MYEDFCSVIDSQLDSKPTGKGSRNNKKAWWNDDLGNLSKKVRMVLRQWERNKSDEALKSAYLEKQKKFSTWLCGVKCKFRQIRNNKPIEQQKQNPRVRLVIDTARWRGIGVCLGIGCPFITRFAALSPCREGGRIGKLYHLLWAV